MFTHCNDPPGCEALLDQLGQVASRNVLHGQVVLAVALAGIVNADNMRVREPRHRPGLAMKPADHLRR